MGKNYEIGEQLQFDIKEDGKLTSNDEVKASARRYWQACLNLLNAWGEYNAKLKFRDNCINHVRFGTFLAKRAKEVFDTNFGGDIGRVSSRVNQLRDSVKDELAVYEAECQRCGVHPVDESWLERHARNGELVGSYRGKIQTKIKNASEPIPMEDIPPYKPRNNR